MTATLYGGSMMSGKYKNDMYLGKDLYIDFDAHELVLKDSTDGSTKRTHSLTGSQYVILRYLASNLGKICSREDIIKTAMGYGNINSIDKDLSTQLNKHIHNIRRLITELTGDEGFAFSLIETRKGQGIRLNTDGAIPKEETPRTFTDSEEADMQKEFFQSIRDEQNGNLEQAIDTNERLAAKGFALSINFLGVMHAKGKWYPLDKEKGISYYKEAADKGCSIAMLNLADCYLDRMGGHYDPEEAVKLYTKAATDEKEPDGDAMYRLYMCYSEGIGCKKNEETAQMWKERAAEKKVYKYNNYYLN